jgi:hypothetical protein
VELPRTGERLLRLAAEQGCPGALRALAVEAEWRLADFSLALEYTNRALALDTLKESLREDFSLRRERLRKKIGGSAAGKRRQAPFTEIP